MKEILFLIILFKKLFWKKRRRKEKLLDFVTQLGDDKSIKSNIQIIVLKLFT